MTITNLTVNISNTIYPVLNGSYTLDDKVDERSTVRLTIFDANSTYSFQLGQPVTITDTVEGIKFTGFIAKAVAVKYPANASLAWSLDCVDNQFLAGKKTSNRVITNQYAGIAAISMVNDHLSQDGVIANYAVRDDNTQTEFAQGTLSNTVATSNLGGSLELSLAGTPVTNSGSGGISGTSPAIKLIGTSSQGYNNNYCYRMIYNDGNTTVTSGDSLSYDIWIQSDSPEIKAGVDIVFTDGTSFRDSTDAGQDPQGLGPHPNKDLSGLADNNAWYGRGFGVIGALIGKTIQYFSIAFEGDTKGIYTAYFRNIQFRSSSGVKVHVFDNTQNTLQVNAALQSRGYSNVSVSVINAFDNITNYTLGTVSIDAVKIVKSSYMNWSIGNTASGASYALVQSQINSSATSPAATVQTSIDNGASWQSIANNSAIPNLQPGMSVASRSIQYRATLLLGIDPTIAPSFNGFNILVNPAYQATKLDSITTATTQSNFNAGTYSNTQGLSGGGVSILGSTRSYDTIGDYFNQTLYGTTTPYHFNYLKTSGMQTSGATDARLRFDFSGQWANFITEIDIQVSVNYQLGLVYRTTNWGNSNDSYAYSVGVSLTSILFARGNNSTGAGSFHQITNIATISLAEGSWHRLKIIANGSNHQIFLDGATYINTTDSTYTAAGYLGSRIYTSGSPLVTGYFDNFGVVSALTGQWTSQSISLASLGNYGTSMIQWDTNQIPSSCQVTAVTSIDGGSSYQAITNGGTISGLTAGQSLSGKNLLVQLQLTAGDSTAIPIVNGVTAWVQGQYSAGGTRIAPFLSLSNAGIAGSTLTAWRATTPTNTSVALSTSLNGTSYSSATNGGSIVGITSQPSPILDTFDSNLSPNYTNTSANGGVTASWLWDTLNSRLVATDGITALLLYKSISALNVDIIIDMDQTDTGGVVWRYVDVSNYYQIIVNDASSSSNDTNVISLVKRASGIRNFLAAGAIAFARGTKRRIRVIMVAGLITVYFDGTVVLAYIDPSPLGTGKVGLSHDNGTSQFYNFRIQPQGDNLSNKVVYSKVTLTSTDPTQTPQLTDLTVAALHPNIGIGNFIPTADYTNTYLSDNFSDLATKSDYTWFIDQNLNFILGPRVAQPAPWILQSSDQQLLLDGPLTVNYSSDLYRNEMILDNVVATGTRSEIKIGDGITTSWALGGELIGPPLMYLNNQLKTIGIKGIDTGKDFYWTPGSNAIDQDASGTILQQTDTLSFQNYTYQYLTSITVDNTNLANTVTQKQFAAVMGHTLVIASIYNSVSSAHTISGDAGDLDVSKCRRIAVDANITAVSGTTPTIQFFVDRKDVNGIYYNLWSSSVISTANQISVTMGAFSVIKQALGAIVRLRWIIGGITPSFTFSISILGILDVQSAGLGIVAVKEDVSSMGLDVQSAVAYGNSQLQRYGTQGRTITLKTWRRNPSLAIGQYLPIFLPEHKINDASMLITAISTSQNIGYENGVPTQIYWQHVTCTENSNLGSPWKLLASTLK